MVDVATAVVVVAVLVTSFAFELVVDIELIALVAAGIDLLVGMLVHCPDYYF
jgi:hypothetical protein